MQHQFIYKRTNLLYTVQPFKTRLYLYSILHKHCDGCDLTIFNFFHNNKIHNKMLIKPFNYSSLTEIRYCFSLVDKSFIHLQQWQNLIYMIGLHNGLRELKTISIPSGLTEPSPVMGFTYNDHKELNLHQYSLWYIWTFNYFPFFLIEGECYDV